MVNLNSVFKIILFLISSFEASEIFGQQNISPEEVKEFVLKSYKGEVVPRDYLAEKSSKEYEIFYCDKICIIHIGYRSYWSECMMKTSLVVVAELQKNGKWDFIKIIPFYYELQLINKQHKIFTTTNEFCEPNGICNTYSAVLFFDSVNLDFVKLTQALSFDKYLYFDRLLSIGRSSGLEKKIGDTITSLYTYKNFNFTEHDKISLIRTREYSVLTGVMDSISTKNGSDTKKLRLVLSQFIEE